MIDSGEATGDRTADATGQTLPEADVARMVAQHATLRRLCGALEACADDLPDRDALVRAIGVSAALAIALGEHEVVDNAVLGRLFASDPAAEVTVLFKRIRHRHAIDHLHAEDLNEALSAAALTLDPIRFDALSYMMRCLFDGCHRGIDFQEAAILMLAGGRLTPGARATFNASLTGNG